VHGARVAFTTRSEGNLALHVGDDPAEVRRRRAALAEEAGSGPFIFMNQTHSSDVLTLTERPGDEPTPEGLDARTVDAMVSTDLPMGVLVADCLPVVLIAEGTGGRPAAVAVAHAGRAGVLNGILPAAVEALRTHASGQTDPSDESPAVRGAVVALIGPAVCGRCYEVPEEMAAEAEMAVPGIRTETRWGTPALDLKAAARAQMESLGVDVRDVEICTMESEAHSSHRRDPRSGRIAGLVYVPDAENAGADA
jgi:YfiH family protein